MFLIFIEKTAVPLTHTYIHRFYHFCIESNRLNEFKSIYALGRENYNLLVMKKIASAINTFNSKWLII